jgi:hypothetical protein
MGSDPDGTASLRAPGPEPSWETALGSKWGVGPGDLSSEGLLHMTEIKGIALCMAVTNVTQDNYLLTKLKGSLF